MNQTNHFFNLGYGWLCKHCSAAETEAKHRYSDAPSSSFSHSDSEKKETNTPGLALATWTDSSRHGLICPRCGIKETLKSE